MAVTDGGGGGAGSGGQQGGGGGSGDDSTAGNNFTNGYRGNGYVTLTWSGGGGTPTPNVTTVPQPPSQLNYW